MLKQPPQPELDAFERLYDELVAEHRGRWVAICGNRLVGVGETLSEARRRAEEAGCRAPFLTRVAPEAWEDDGVFCGDRGQRGWK